MHAATSWFISYVAKLCPQTTINYCIDGSLCGFYIIFSFGCDTFLRYKRGSYLFKSYCLERWVSWQICKMEFLVNSYTSNEYIHFALIFRRIRMRTNKRVRWFGSYRYILSTLTAEYICKWIFLHMFKEMFFFA